jgi:hypothetical protein
MSEEPTQGPCTGCGKNVDDENFCFGCKAFICDDCTANDISGFTHVPAAHLESSACCGAGVTSGECIACGGPAN